MNQYTQISLRATAPEASSLSARLSAWHDQMVAHERRLRDQHSATCDESCPHAEARDLWAEALAVFGADAWNLLFLRSRALGPR